MTLPVNREVSRLKKGILSANEIPPEFIDNYRVRRTTVLEKAIPSLINAVIAFGIATPFLLIDGPSLMWRCSVVVIFALYELVMVKLFRNRCLGMKIMDTYWEKDYATRQLVIYNTFYTLSFATIMVYIWRPFDLLMINLLIVQLPMILITGTTLHGYLGGMETVRIIKKEK